MALMNKVPTDLLNAAIHIYSGQPQPLWWLGTHHSAKAVWQPVIELVARTPFHPLFELGWDHISYHGDGARMSSIIECVGVEEVDRMLDILIRLKVGCTGNYLPEAWASVLAMAKDEGTRASWLDRMVLYVPAILDDLSDLEFWLSEEQDRREMLDRLKSDTMVLQITKIDIQNVDHAEAREFEFNRIQVLKRLVQNKPPRLFNTCDRLVSWLETVDLPTKELIEACQRQREVIFDERRRIEEEFDEAEYSLCGWTRPGTVACRCVCSRETMTLKAGVKSTCERGEVSDSPCQRSAFMAGNELDWSLFGRPGAQWQSAKSLSEIPSAADFTVCRARWA